MGPYIYQPYSLSHKPTLLFHIRCIQCKVCNDSSRSKDNVIIAIKINALFLQLGIKISLSHETEPLGTGEWTCSLCL